MRKAIFLVFVICISGCGSDGPAPTEAKSLAAVWHISSDPSASNYLTQIDLTNVSNSPASVIMTASGIECTCAVALSGTSSGTITASACVLSAGSGSCTGYEDIHDFENDGTTLHLSKINGLNIYFR